MGRAQSEAQDRFRTPCLATLPTHVSEPRHQQASQHSFHTPFWDSQRPPTLPTQLLMRTTEIEIHLSEFQGMAPAGDASAALVA